MTSFKPVGRDEYFGGEHMDYHYEALNDQRFQKLSQALIVAQNPNTQCLPVGQPDGGRDAYLFHTESDQNKLVVFQVKFSRDPSSKSRSRFCTLQDPIACATEVEHFHDRLTECALLYVK